ncbi:MAG: 2-octaprenyl-6-methoxyphenyl hydroxylase [Lysobacteraceae bacterium]|nr:MAG: 2-octaprenyl-6-methoxyphenyl hydroxylase [Xanthomonadaceae bacterium]
MTHIPGPALEAVHDVLIVGGGLVGASLAIALSRTGIDTALVEATPPGVMPAVFDQRNLSLAEATVNALHALGVLQHLRTAAGPIARIHISRRGDFGRVVLDAADYGRRAFGQVVVARDFGEALEATLADLDGLTRYRPLRFIGMEDASGAGENQPRKVRLADDGGERLIGARLVVGADGTVSAVREGLGIATERYDYAQTLLVARLGAERAPDGTAWERLDDHGPTALLPRGDGYYGLVHGVARDEADKALALDDVTFLARVQRIFGWRAGRFVSIGPRSAYPLVRVLAQRLIASRAVLVGNAAQTLHPIGAQGFNLGLRDALTLVECIEAGGGDPGSATVLAEYARRRREDRERTLAFSHGLALRTADASSLASRMRSLGLLALDQADALRSQLVGGAMGYRGDIPRLCRGEVA